MRKFYTGGTESLGLNRSVGAPFSQSTSTSGFPLQLYILAVQPFRWISLITDPRTTSTITPIPPASPMVLSISSPSLIAEMSEDYAKLS